MAPVGVRTQIFQNPLNTEYLDTIKPSSLGLNIMVSLYKSLKLKGRLSGFKVYLKIYLKPLN